MSDLIPNSFQHPNFYVDILDQYLTAEESKVLTHAIREILGFRDTLQTRKKRIAYSVFLHGKIKDKKRVYHGVNLNASALKSALDALHDYNILVRVGSLRHPKGQLYELIEDTAQIKFEKLLIRKTKKQTTGKEKMQKARNAKEQKREDITLLTHRRVCNSSDTQRSYSSDTQREGNSDQKLRSETQKEEREREEKSPPVPSQKKSFSESQEKGKRPEKKKPEQRQPYSDEKNVFLTPSQYQRLCNRYPEPFFLNKLEDFSLHLIPDDPYGKTKHYSKFSRWLKDDFPTWKREQQAGGGNGNGRVQQTPELVPRPDLTISQEEKQKQQQAIFDTLSEDEQTRLRSVAEQEISRCKQSMNPEVYQHTLHLAILQQIEQGVQL